MMNEQKCKEYSGEEIGRLVQVRYEERDEGFSCASCAYFGENFCEHPKVQAKVEAEGCCTEWAGQSKFKPQKC